MKATKGLYEEPSLFAGVRPYQPGDSMRRVHWKATARLGVPVSRRYDPARERELLIAVDMQTMPGDAWMLNWDDDLVEGLCIAALSLARASVGDGMAAGLAVNAFSDRPQRTVYVPPSAAAGQLAAMADLLADISPYASVPFERLLARGRTQGATRDFGHRPQQQGSGRVRADAAQASCPGLPGHRRRVRTGGRRVERPCALARRAECRLST